MLAKLCNPFILSSLLILNCFANEQVNILSGSSIVPMEYYNNFKTASKLIDISYCISPGNKIGFPFECHDECSDFPNTTLIHQFTGDNSLQTLTVTGYIAIDHSKQLIFLSLRGTRSFSDLLTDIDSQQFPVSHLCFNCRIHKGFYETFENTLFKVDEYLRSLVQNYPDYHFLVMGHSLGGAIATLITHHIKSELNFTNVKCITMGLPILGNEFLANYLHQVFKTGSLNLDDRSLYRITNKGDPIPTLPISTNGYIYQQLLGEIFISNLEVSTLSPQDVVVCQGNQDFNCVKNLYSGFNSHLIYFKKLGYCGYGFN